MATERRRDAARARPRPREAELIARWGAGVWRGRTLWAADGGAYTVIYQGRPGGSAGPDFRDAALLTASGERIIGDIELHLSPAGWRAHGHTTDPRYNNVALHVTLRLGAGADSAGAPLASGRRAPLVALSAQPEDMENVAPAPPWPCAPLAGEGAAPAVRHSALARRAGWARLHERASVLAVARARAALSASAHMGGLWGPADRALFTAIAEALGYGRDRDTLRRCGERLACGAEPDALAAEAARLGVVERRRVAGLLALRTRWLAAGPLAALRVALSIGAARAGAPGAARALVEELASPGKGIISRGRARIIAINVALPFLLLDARDADDTARWDMTIATIEGFPGLPSNQITRVMAAQLGLARAPAGALAQQGLHHLWERHCREKRCAACPCAR